MLINSNSDNIKVNGYKGKWYVVATVFYDINGFKAKAYELEHESWGDYVPHIYVNRYGQAVDTDTVLANAIAWL